MATNTTNYNLVKPALNETADIQVINDNMDKIDTEIKKTNDTKVPTSTTVNGKTLTSNITVTGADIKATGYAKASSQSAIAATDTLNTALGKLEKKADDVISSKAPFLNPTFTGETINIKKLPTDSVASIMSEANGTLIDFGTNYTQSGFRDNSKNGAMFRIDTRDTHPLFNVIWQPSGGTAETTPFSVTREGNVNTLGGINATKSITTNEYINMNAWSGYGTGTAGMWYDGNLKQIYVTNANKMTLSDKQIATTETVELTLQNGWVSNAVETYGTASATRIGDTVFLHGYIRNGTKTINTVIANNLPSAFKPSLLVQTVMVVCSDLGTYTFGKLAVRSAGDIIISLFDLPYNNAVFLDGISYKLR